MLTCRSSQHRRRHYGRKATVSWLLFCDRHGSAMIIAASRIAFPECPRAMCWAHVVRNLDKKLLGVTNVDRKNRFRRDLFVLHLATSPAEFKDVWALFKAHYRRY